MLLITTPEQLFEEVCNCFKVEPIKINVKSKRTEVLRIRQYYAYVGDVYYKFSLASLGKVLVSQKSKISKSKDHSCIIHSRDKVIDLLSVNDVITYNDIEILKSHLELNIKEKLEYDELEQDYNNLVRDYAQLKALNKRLQREKNELTNANISLRQELKKLRPTGIFGQSITITKLNESNGK